MRRMMVLAGILSAGAFYAQNQYRGNVGINTTTPGATLEVNIVEDAARGRKVGQGVVVPRVSKSRLSEMTEAIVESSLVYVNDITTALVNTGNTRVSDVTSIGFYYFDKTKWVKIGSGAGTSAPVTWEAIRYGTGATFTQTANDQLIPDTAWFVISTWDKIRLPQMFDTDAGRMITIFKRGAGNTSVLDYNGNANGMPGAEIEGTTTVTSSRGKTYIWDGTKWFPLGY